VSLPGSAAQDSARQGGPGRSCPLSYRYDPADFSRGTDFQTETLWVVGGLYGNRFALERLLELYEAERGTKALVFNGDFHWFDVDTDEFAAVDAAVRGQRATRGNVETELAQPAAGAGCGCGYPDWVGDGEVERSNRIIERLRDTARGLPVSLEHFASLPMHLVAGVGDERVAIVHGDAGSLAGWGFSQEALATPDGRAAAVASFAAASVRVFASSHTCLPVLQAFAGSGVIANNGAAGMPNFRADLRGLATRISVRPHAAALYGIRAGSLQVEAIALDYDPAAWRRVFLAQWPEGSPAHRSYFARIVEGPRYRLEQALRAEAAAAA
jgi:hypothetical protein